MTATERTSFIPPTLEGLIVYLESRGWCWKLNSYQDDGGHRVFRAVVYRPDWPNGYGQKKRVGMTPYETLRDALKYAWGKAKALRRRQAEQAQP